MVRRCLRWVVPLATAALLCSTVHGQSIVDQTAKVDRVVARVSEVWSKDKRYEAFHRELSASFAGTPEWGVFSKKEQWVSVVSTKSLMYPGVFKGRSPQEMGLQLGDIVEMRVGAKGAKTYAELGEVVKVRCRRADAGFEKCAQENPLEWFDAQGARVELAP